MKGQLRIDEVYVFIATDSDGTEGIPAFRAPDGMMLPLVGADQARVDSLRRIAQTMVDQEKNLSIKLVRFSTREELETFQKSKP